MYGMVWYGMVYLFLHRQYKVISKQIASEMSQILSMKGDHHITRRLSYHSYYIVTHKTLINKKEAIVVMVPPINMVQLVND